MSKTIAVIGALDTKGSEFAFVRREIERRGHRTLVIDTGVIGEPTLEPNIPASQGRRGGRIKPVGPAGAERPGHGHRSDGPRRRRRCASALRRRPDRRRAEHGRQRRNRRGHGGHARLAGGRAQGDGEHGGIGRHERLRGHQGRGDAALNRGRGGCQPHQRPHLRQRRGRGGGHGGNGRPADRGQAADRRLDVRQHHAGGGNAAASGWTRWATRCWCFTPPAPAGRTMEDVNSRRVRIGRPGPDDHRVGRTNWWGA